MSTNGGYMSFYWDNWKKKIPLHLFLSPIASTRSVQWAVRPEWPDTVDSAVLTQMVFREHSTHRIICGGERGSDTRRLSSNSAVRWYRPLVSISCRGFDLSRCKFKVAGWQTPKGPERHKQRKKKTSLLCSSWKRWSLIRLAVEPTNLKRLTMRGIGHLWAGLCWEKAPLQTIEQSINRTNQIRTYVIGFDVWSLSVSTTTLGPLTKWTPSLPLRCSR